VNAVTIAAIVTGIITVIGALTTAIISIITTVNKTKDTVDKVANASTARDVKLDRIEILVDGRYSQVLQELADVKRLLAAESGKPSDLVKAQEAQIKADDQKSRVDAAPKIEPKIN
jgi:hypothetical protein